jgi:hypothetical protein
MPKKRLAGRSKTNPQLRDVGWEIENGSYKTDGTHSTAVKFIQDFRTEKEARTAWATNNWAHIHPHYLIFIRSGRLSDGRISKEWIEVVYSYGPHHSWEYGVMIPTPSADISADKLRPLPLIDPEW